MILRTTVELGGKTATGFEVPAERYVLQVEGAKKAETRQRRVADTITRLTNGEA